MTNPNLSAELREAGFELRREGYRIMVSPASKLSEKQKESIRANRILLLAELPAVTNGKEKWDEYEATRLGRMAIHKLKTAPDDPMIQKASGSIQDRIDAAFAAQDMGMLRNEVAGLLAGLDAIMPRRVGKGTQYAPEERATSWTAWLRLNAKHPWVPVISEVGDRGALVDMMIDYEKLYKSCDVIILSADKEP